MAENNFNIFILCFISSIQKIKKQKTWTYFLFSREGQNNKLYIFIYRYIEIKFWNDELHVHEVFLNWEYFCPTSVGREHILLYRYYFFEYLTSSVIILYLKVYTKIRKVLKYFASKCVEQNSISDFSGLEQILLSRPL